ncbi:hypothetical protein BD626DRAFT_12721 [Schizophyllum amplum]|uniref:Uncharacterized protein n=1 Tax=Schizophyllum amplum TaxID=97359 RepID=A0A550CXH9_9AGAR|nr:hypothetical protein BD626DRAFT_12721 [Auriculariopsis ampla]
MSEDRLFGHAEVIHRLARCAGAVLMKQDDIHEIVSHLRLSASFGGLPISLLIASDNSLARARKNVFHTDAGYRNGHLIVENAACSVRMNWHHRAAAVPPDYVPLRTVDLALTAIPRCGGACPSPYTV